MRGPHSRSTPRESDEVAVARVVGASLGDRIHGGFVVLPRLFVDGPLTQESITSVPADQQVALLDGLRRGGDAPWADTASLRDGVGFDTLPASSRTIVTLAGPVVVDGDTARTLVYIGGASHRAGRPVFYTIEQYVVARTGSSWHFVRRRLMYAT